MARLRSAAALVASVALGGALLWLALRGADLAAVAAALRGAAWGWLLPLGLASLVSVGLRAWRWRLLLDALPGGGPAGRTPLGLVVGAVFVGYLVNLVAPRAGEVVRSGTVAAQTGRPFAAVVGTVVAERVLDVAMLLGAIASVAALYGGRLAPLAAGAAETLGGLLGRVPGGLAGLAALGALGAAAGLLGARALLGRGGRVGGLLAAFRDGLLAALRTRRPVALVASTAALWASYAVMADLPLRLLGLSDAYGLGLLDAWALMTVGAVGMALPAPGGVGTFHYATVQALGVLFAVPETPAAAYAVLGHAAQVVFYAVGGALALVAGGAGLRAAASAARRTAGTPADDAPVKGASAAESRAA